MLLGDSIGIILGDGLDIDAALRRDHGNGFARATVHRHADVVLIVEVDALLDEHAVDSVPLELHPEDVLGGLAGLILARCDLDPAGLPAAADVDLCLDGRREADLVDGVDDTLDAVGKFRFRHRNPGFLENLLCLKLVESHCERVRNLRLTF